jgi:hypothetical protein
MPEVNRPTERSGSNDTALIQLASLNQAVLDARRPALDPARVTHYMKAMNIERAGPVVVYCDSVDGLTLANGHHRVEASTRMGRTAIKAELRSGNRQHASTYRDYETPRTDDSSPS